MIFTFYLQDKILNYKIIYVFTIIIEIMMYLYNTYFKRIINHHEYFVKKIIYKKIL